MMKTIRSKNPANIVIIRHIHIIFKMVFVNKLTKSIERSLWMCAKKAQLIVDRQWTHIATSKKQKQTQQKSLTKEKIDAGIFIYI